jgi:WXG100 family type VII secretion target
LDDTRAASPNNPGSTTNVSFKEDPQQIADTATRLRDKHGSVTESLGDMMEKIKITIRQCWKSDSSDEYQRKAAELDASGQELLGVLKELIEKLEKASGIYTVAESDATKTAEGLPTEGVFR